MTIGWIPLGIGIVLIVFGLLFIWSGRGTTSNVGRIMVELRGWIGLGGRGPITLIVLGLVAVGGGIFLLTRTPHPIPEDAITANASSVHPPDPHGLTYDARNTLDDNWNTAWNGDGPCVGCTLRYDFGRPRNLEVIAVVNGYAKNDFVFQANARLKDVRLIVSGEHQIRRTLRDTTETQDIHGDFGTTEFVEIEILSVYPGNEPDLNDAALTEVDFFEKPVESCPVWLASERSAASRASAELVNCPANATQ